MGTWWIVSPLQQAEERARLYRMQRDALYEAAFAVPGFLRLQASIFRNPNSWRLDICAKDAEGVATEVEKALSLVAPWCGKGTPS